MTTTSAATTASAAALLALVLSACGGGATASSPSASPTPSPSASAPQGLPTALPEPPDATYSPAPLDVSPGPEALAAFDWASPEPLTVAGWGLESCEGDAPLVCVSGPDGESGDVELLSFPLASLPEPVRQPDADAALRAHVDGYLAGVREDRASCGEGYLVTPSSVELFDARGGRVVRYGFTGGSGEVTEKTVQYAAVRGQSLVVLDASAYDEGGCLAPEGDLTTSALTAFAPVLDAVVRVTELR